MNPRNLALEPALSTKMVFYILPSKIIIKIIIVAPLLAAFMIYQTHIILPTIT